MDAIVLSIMFFMFGFACCVLIFSYSIYVIKKRYVEKIEEVMKAYSQIDEIYNKGNIYELPANEETKRTD